MFKNNLQNHTKQNLDNLSQYGVQTQIPDVQQIINVHHIYNIDYNKLSDGIP